MSIQLTNTWTSLPLETVFDTILAIDGVVTVRTVGSMIHIESEITISEQVVIDALNAEPVPPVWNIGGFEFEQLSQMDQAQWTDGELREIVMQIVKRLR